MSCKTAWHAVGTMQSQTFINPQHTQRTTYIINNYTYQLFFLIIQGIASITKLLVCKKKN